MGANEKEKMSGSLFETFIKVGIDSSEVNSGINDLKTSTLKMGDVLKANLISDAVQKGITFVVDGLKKMGDLAISFGKSAISSSIEFESAFTGVKKTVDATEEDLQRFGGSQEAFYKDLSGWIKEEATQTASTKERIADVMAISGQLGVRGSENLKKFTETMIMMGDSTDLSAEEAAMSIAQLMNITGDSYDNTDKLGSAIVALGNNFATTEPQIVNMAQRLASTGTISNLSATEIVALATAMSTVGIQAEAGGTAMTQTLTAISQAVSGAGQTSEEYSKAQEKVRKKTQALEKAELAYQQALEKSGVSSAKAQTALNNVEKAQSKYNAAVEKYGENSPQAVQAMQNLENAQIKYNDVLSASSDKVQTAALKVTQAQEDLTIAQKALDDAASGASGSLGLIAKVAGMSADQFAETWKTKPIEAITEFIKGLGTLEERGMDINQVLGTLEMDGVRQGNMLKSLSLATDQLTGTLEVANKAYEEGNALSEEAGTRYEDAASKVNQVKEAYSNLTTEIGSNLEPTYKGFLDLVRDGLIDMTNSYKEDGFQGLFDTFKRVINDLIEFVAQELSGTDFENAGKSIISTIVQGITDNADGLIESASTILTTLLTAVNDNLEDTAPLISKFVEGLAVIIAENADLIAEAGITLLGAIGQGLVDAAPEMAKHAPEVIEAIASSLAEHPEALILLGPTLIGFLGSGITTAASLLKPLGDPIAQEIAAGIGTKVSGTMTTIGTAATTDMGAAMAAGGATAAGTAAAAVGGSFIAAFGGAEIGKNLGAAIFPDDEELYEHYSGITGTFEMIKDSVIGLVDLISIKGENIVTNLSAGWEEIQRRTKEKWEQVKNDISEEVEDAKTKAVDKFTELQDRTEEAWSMIELFTGEAWDSMTEHSSQAAEDIYSGIVDAWDALATETEDEWNAIKDFFDNTIGEMADNALDWGRDLIDNFIDGLMDKWEALKSTVRDIADSIKDFLGFSVPEKGPLADADTYAPDMMKLFAKGIKDNERLVTDQIEDSFNFGKVIEDQDFGFTTSGSANAVSGSASMDRVVALLQRIVDEGLHSDIDLKGDAADIFSLVRRKNHEFTEATGYSGL